MFPFRQPAALAAASFPPRFAPLQGLLSLSLSERVFQSAASLGCSVELLALISPPLSAHQLL